jgi:hypothetical protein
MAERKKEDYNETSQAQWSVAGGLACPVPEKDRATETDIIMPIANQIPKLNGLPQNW